MLQLPQPSEALSNITLRQFLNLTNNSEYADSVTEHWLRQTPPNPMVQYALAIIVFVVSVPSQICQILVIFAYLRTRRLRTPSNKLIVNLTVADFMLLFMCHFVSLQNVLGPMLGIWFGAIGCKVYAFITSTAALAEIWTLTLVSVDRCQAIFHPLETKKRMTSVQVHRYLAVIWTTATLFSIFPLIGWNHYLSEPYLLGCSFDSWDKSYNSRSYVIILTLLAWFVPLSIIASGYIRIIYSVKSNLFSPRQDNVISAEVDRARRIEMSLARMVFIILVIWVFAWTPYVVESMWIMFFDGLHLTPELAIAPSLCCKLSAALNAFIYGVRLPKFKKEIDKIICRKRFRLVLSATNISSENGRSMLKHDKSESGAVQLRSHPSILKKRTKSTETNTSATVQTNGETKTTLERRETKTSLIPASFDHKFEPQVLFTVTKENQVTIVINQREIHQHAEIVKSEMV